MSGSPLRTCGMMLSLLMVALTAGCGWGAPTAPVDPSPSISDIAESILPTPAGGPSVQPTLDSGVSVLPTPAMTAIREGLLMLVVSEADSDQATLEVSEPDGSMRQILAVAAPDPRSTALSPDNRYAALFTADGTRDGSLIVWGLDRGEMVLDTDVSTEVSGSFRDAPPERYLAWSPDSQSLAIVMNRDLHILNVADQDLELLVRHREEGYVVAGTVMGSISRPTWTPDGAGIVYDAWSPPEMLSEQADDMRDVEYVEVSTGTTVLIMEGARVAQQAVGGVQELLLEQQDGQLVSLGLITREVREAVPTEVQGDTVCDSGGTRCASIVPTREDGDMLRLEVLPQGTQIDDLPVTDFGKATSDCRVQSALWSSDGDTLLATIGCATHVGLWSILIPDLEIAHHVDWTDAGSVILLGWFE